MRSGRDELQAIYDGIADGVLLTEIATKRFLRVNSSACRMLGYSEEELLSMSVTDIHSSEDVPMIREAFRALKAASLSLRIFPSCGRTAAGFMRRSAAAASLWRAALFDRVLPRHHGAAEEPRRPWIGNAAPWSTCCKQRSRAAIDRLRHPRRPGPADRRGPHAVRYIWVPQEVRSKDAASATTPG